MDGWLGWLGAGDGNPWLADPYCNVTFRGLGRDSDLFPLAKSVSIKLLSGVLGFVGPGNDNIC